jgi:hypothetical protein
VAEEEQEIPTEEIRCIQIIQRQVAVEDKTIGLQDQLVLVDQGAAVQDTKVAGAVVQLVAAAAHLLPALIQILMVQALAERQDRATAAAMATTDG